MPLPQETLALVFSHLEQKELFQCQLTSKQWHKASLRPLYTNLLVDTIEKFCMYVRTITYSPQLGKYLNTIDFQYLFYIEGESDELEKIGLLDSIIKYCPNIRKFDGYIGVDRFWYRLMYAATQGQLSCLESLPWPYKQHLKSYFDTALVFKNTITCLNLSEDELYPSFHSADLSFETLFNQIDQIKNLKTINMGCFSEKHLSYFDELIDKCHNLKTLHFGLNMAMNIQQPNESGQIILPHPDIQSFECCWEQINANNQLEYLMRKLPNLQRLRIALSNGNACSGHTLVKFIQYAISVPDFELQLEVEDEDILNIFTEFIRIKNGCKNITLGYSYSYNTIYRVNLCAKKGLSVMLPEYRNENEHSHLQILSKVGNSIRSIRINKNYMFPTRRGKIKKTIFWLFEILQLCPLLEEITIDKPSHLLPIHHTLRYPSIKKLTIDGLQYIQHVEFLDCLSLCLPNLCQLSLGLANTNRHPIVINMPHTSFDLLIWRSQSAYRKGSEVYIKLKTEKGLKYYLGKRNMLYTASERRYLLSPKSVQFDINCKHLKELRIRERNLPKSDCDFVF